MPAVGFEMSERSARFIEFTEKSGHLEVKRFGKKQFSLVNGDFTLDQGVRTALGEFVKEHKLKGIKAALPEEKAYLFKMEIPRVDHAQIRSTIEFKLEEQVPIPPSEAVFDYTVVEEGGAEHDHLDVSVTVLPEKVVSSYVELFSGAGLMPLSFEIEPQALSRAVIKRGDSRLYMLVNFAPARTSLSIVSDGVVHFSSTLTLGGNSLTTAIKKYLKISTEEAEKIKKEQGFMKNKDNVELFFSLMSTMSVLRDEMNRVLQYWRTRDKRNAEKEKLIDGIILCGDDVSIEGFKDYFSLSFTIPVFLGDVWANVAPLEVYTPPISFDESFAYGIAIGLALAQK